jgi:putative ABC transport system permease protein
MVLFNLKVLLRAIKKNRVFSAINILGLSLGMACCLMISIYIWDELNYDSFHRKSASIFRITEKQDQAGTLYNVAVSPGPLAPAIDSAYPEIDKTVRFGKWSGLIKTSNQSFEEKQILFTENSIFHVFDFTLLKGNPAKALLAPDEIVITESTAARYFGPDWQTKTGLIGETFSLNNSATFTLAGIAKDPPANSSITFDILLPIQHLFLTDKWSNKWSSNNFHTYVLLNDPQNAAALQQKMKYLLAKYVPDTKDELQLQPLSKQYLYSKFDFNTDWGKRSDIKYVKIFAGVGLLLLIIAGMNFVNLSTARSLKRAGEVGVRKVTGASRMQLIRQFLTESIFISTIAGICSILLVKIAAPYVHALTGSALNLTLLDYRLIIALLLLITGIGIIAGIYPALLLSAYEPVSVLKGFVNTKRGRPFWHTLVVCQFAISIALIIGTIFMYQQLVYIQNKDLGFDKSQLLTVRLKGELQKKQSLFRKELAQQPSIAGAAPATVTMVNVDNSSYVEWEGMAPDDKFLITQANVSPDFIPLLGLKLLSGQNFSEQFSNDTANFIINEMAAQRMGYTSQSAIGKQISFWGAKGSIIGVVRDFHFKSLGKSIEPFILRYQPQDRYFTMFVKTVPGKTKVAIAQLEVLFRKFEKEYPMEFSFVEESLNQLYEGEQRTANFIFIFSFLTVFVGCLGLLGVTVFATEQRLKEIGVRKVLGAGANNIAFLLSKDFLKLIVLAAVLAAPAAWWAVDQWLQNFAFRIVVDPLILLVAGASIVVIAGTVVYLYTMKAARINPVIPLRSE